MGARQRCSGTVWEDLSRRFLQCRNAGKVEHDGKFYCGTHDPERKKAKDAARNAKWEQERVVAGLSFKVEQAERVLLAAVMACDVPEIFPQAVYEACIDVADARAALAASRSSQGAPKR